MKHAWLTESTRVRSLDDALGRRGVNEYDLYAALTGVDLYQSNRPIGSPDWQEVTPANREKVYRVIKLAQQTMEKTYRPDSGIRMRYEPHFKAIEATYNSQRNGDFRDSVRKLVEQLAFERYIS